MSRLRLVGSGLGWGWWGQVLRCASLFHARSTNPPGADLLSQAIFEGVCDFVAELVTGKTMPLPYMTFGPAHEDSLKASFREEMFAHAQNRWLYNNGHGVSVADLGDYTGYAIAKSFYQRASDKRAAIRQMIELDFTGTLATEAFLAKSQYYRVAAGSGGAAARI